MKVSVTKRNSNILDISLNSQGKKLIYNSSTQKETDKIDNSNSSEQTPSIQNNTPPPPPKTENKTPFNIILPKKRNEEKLSFQFSKSPDPSTPQSSANQNQNDKYHYTPRKNENEPTRQANEQSKEKHQISSDKIIQQKEYLKSVQKLIDTITSNTPEKMIDELQSNIEQLGDMLKTVISYDDTLLNETKIIISYIDLFQNNSIVDNPKLTSLYFIFFDSNQLLIQNQLIYYFNSNATSIPIETIVQFLTKLCNTSENRKIILNFYQKVSNSNQITISDQTKGIINHEIEELQTKISTKSDKNKFYFDDQIIFKKLNDSELSNDYKSPWPSVESYIKVMLNLSVENFFYPFRIHLNELKNNELDPRDLYLYEKVRISSCNTFDDKSEYDFFIKCSIRAPTYKDGNTIKNRQLRKIDWELTDRLSNRSLLFFSFSPTMEKIEAVAISKAKKGEITDDLIIPISMLQGNLKIDQEYFMFEPIDQWNLPFFNNLLNTNEKTLPTSLVKPIVSLDFSDNLINFSNDDDSLFCTSELFKSKSDYSCPKYEINSTNGDVNYFCKELISKLENSKKLSLNKILNDLCNQLNALERQRGNLNRIEKDSEIATKVSTEIRKYFGYQNPTQKWPFDDFTPEQFKEKCVVDHEQYKTLKYSLNHHLTLVNGAPGTGKTYLACELVKFLIKSHYKHPILVVTYKNVSLDGFLDNIADFLQKNEVDFVRIGGKPRTENQFILEKQIERKMPVSIQKVKNQILNLTSLRVLVNSSLNQLKPNEISDDLRSTFYEINKSINIKKIMFNQFRFYSKEEEKIITNFYDSIFFIPSADKYVNCWLLGKDYYEEVKLLLHRNLNEIECNLLGQFSEYLNKKSGEKNNEIINSIIIDFFSGDERSFSTFLNNKKKKIFSNDTTVLSDILNENHHQYFDDDDRDRESDHLLYYLDNISNDSIPKQVSDKIRNEFVKMINTKNDKMNSLTHFLNEISTILSNYSKIEQFELIQKVEEFEKKEIADFGLELSKKKLIAMTATRCAQFKSSLDLSSVRFMIIEEAGELTEPMAFSIIPKPIENLVMIGDYRQLRPTVEHQLKFSPYFHDISLFEKEVIHSKSIHSSNLFTLSIQRRMHPQISSLIRRVFYNNNSNDDDDSSADKLNDDESVSLLDKPIGFPNHIQFWLHEFDEEKENLKARSHVNVKEAQICAYLFLMMLCRGYKSNEITIISLYKGQKRQIEKELAKLIDFYYNDDYLTVYDAFDFENDQPGKDEGEEETRDLNELIEKRKSLVGKYVKCIDDFQGEENEVIIISLTRSEKPGFVKNENRALVTLSRAKQMEFVIGNKKIFGQQNKLNPLWQKISSEASSVDQNVMNFNGIVALSCPFHSKQKTTILLNKPNHFIECRFNCCTQNCNVSSFCGHKCVLPCHFHSEILKNKPKLLDVLKRRYFCEERCSRRCKKGHQCEEMCGNCMHFGCPPCTHLCDNKCSLCDRHCSLSCSHKGDCQCRFTGNCADCHAKITDLHKNLKFWNNSELLCNKCFFRRVESRKYQKGIFKT